MADLADCPCCGAGAKLVKREGFGPAGGKFSRGYVACRRCGITTPTKSPWQKAVDLWNARPSARALTMSDIHREQLDRPADKETP